MKEDGTVNRAALPAVFNPDDLCALELALQVRDRCGGTVEVLTMGPPRAVDILRDALSRGADKAILLTDRRFAAADTLATSYTLCQAIRKMGDVDLIFCGRQAIDGDTAQVGPQTAEKLGLPQVTYAQEIHEKDGKIHVRREVEGGYEILALIPPALITVTGGYVVPRPRSAKRTIQFRNANILPNITTQMKMKFPDQSEEAIKRQAEEEAARLKEKGLLIDVWSADDIDVEADRIGYGGSPTWVFKVQKVTLQSGEHKSIDASETGIHSLMRELVEDHVLG
ncbi:MAG: electron transfer flavoprotein subunit beta/FixA family protein [Candidatus Omnitrophica bacterium]|nr:electron transfer flavoprotein subunit beta/FixA family protein [Candidatus Omnitrophota bacterium]